MAAFTITINVAEARRNILGGSAGFLELRNMEYTKVFVPHEPAPDFRLLIGLSSRSRGLDQRRARGGIIHNTWL